MLGQRRQQEHEQDPKLDKLVPLMVAGVTPVEAVEPMLEESGLNVMDVGVGGTDGVPVFLSGNMRETETGSV